MLFEFDEDQQLLRATVRDVLSKECPPALVRSVADQGVDPMPLWRTYTTGSADGPDLGEGQTGAAVFEGVSAHLDPHGDGAWILDGTAHHVLDGDRADWFAVVTDAGVFTVPAADATVHRTEAFDPLLHVADVSFWQVKVPASHRVEADVELARDIALTGLALTMVGACRRVLELTLDHVRTREQFGVPIGSFQAVKHKAVDMHVAIERATALAYFAALTLAEEDPRRSTAAAMAKAAAGECTQLVFESGFQLFGGMGFTWENDLQFALKRALAGELLLGGADVHRARIAAALLDGPATAGDQPAKERHSAAV